MTTSELVIEISTFFQGVGVGGGVGGVGDGTPFYGLHMEAPPERGNFFRLQVFERVGISQVEVYERVNLSFRSLK